MISKNILQNQSKLRHLINLVLEGQVADMEELRKTLDEIQLSVLQVQQQLQTLITRMAAASDYNHTSHMTDDD